MTTNDGSLSAGTTTRTVSLALWSAQALLVAVFLFAAFGKLLGDPNQIAGFAKIGVGQWLRYATGVLELAGAIGLFIPRLAGLAALGLVGIMIGAVTFHLTVMPPIAYALFPATVGIVLGLVVWGRWSAVKGLVA